MTRASTTGRPGSSLSSVIGKSRRRTPVAFNTALATAAPAPQNPQFPQALRAEDVGLIVEAVQHDRLDARDVGVHGDQVLGAALSSSWSSKEMAN